LNCRLNYLSINHWKSCKKMLLYSWNWLSI